jgi:hypothetical protein
MAARVEEDAGSAKWDSALARALTLRDDAGFIVDWLRGQADCRFSAAPPASADTWEPTAEPPLGNVSGPLSGTLDADLPVSRE